jgi:CubicO group peptidase (beta-lactamase class C family)
MKKTFGGILALLCLILAMNLSCNTPDQVSHSTAFSPGKVIELDTFINQLQRTLPIPGIAVAIVKDNEILCKTAGYRDQSSRLPLMDSTPFFMGNISELMTATAVIKLAQSGKIKLEDPVIKYLSYFKLAGITYQKIQIRHLLTHTSGVPHHDAVWDLPTFDSHALEATTQSISLQQPEFDPPGSRVKRSQFNYDILADLIEKASGIAFEDYMSKEVLQPLGMNHAAYYSSPLHTDVAVPHVINNWLTYSLAKQEHYPQNREHAGSIGFHASVKDIATWMAMLLHGGIAGDELFIGKDLHHELLKAHYKTGKNSFIGFGWEIRKHNDLSYYTKTHFIGGFCADITMVPEQNIGILVMSNISEEFDPSVITDRILQWLSGGKLDSPKTPINLVMGRMLDSNNCLDSALNLYSHLKMQNPDRYDFSHAALSKLGINLMHRLERKEDAIRVFDFILKQYPSSPYAHLNLAEAYVVNNDIAQAERQLKIVKKLSTVGESTVESHIAYLEEAINIKKEKKHEQHTEDYLSN